MEPASHPPANIAPFVDALGPDLAATFLLAFGGARLHYAAAPTQRSKVVRLIGRDAAAALSRHVDRLPARVPLANRWLAVHLAARGLSVAEIARTIRASDVTVRQLLRQAPPPPQTPASSCASPGDIVCSRISPHKTM